MTETQQRFLKEIADRVGRVAELRLYPTVRVGPIESGVAIVATDHVVAVATGMADGEGQMADEPPADPLPPTDNSRLSIHTAHFRHTVKGPDRGKWEFVIVHDADAPIETVESVVRGVARRAGEDGEPELLSGEDFRHALTEPWWTATS
jgi:hypothetical protein